jgi:hypothetical protein
MSARNVWCLRCLPRGIGILRQSNLQKCEKPSSLLISMFATPLLTRPAFLKGDSTTQQYCFGHFLEASQLVTYHGNFTEGPSPKVDQVTTGRPCKGESNLHDAPTIDRFTEDLSPMLLSSPITQPAAMTVLVPSSTVEWTSSGTSSLMPALGTPAAQSVERMVTGRGSHPHLQSDKHTLQKL